MKRVRLWLRLARLAVVLLLGLALASFVAVVERAYRHDLMALRQRLTAWFLRRLSRALPFDVEVRGELPQGPHLWVGNHVSWTDIPLLGQLLPISFLSKAEVRTWPLAGWLAHKAGTLFIRRGSGDSTLLARQLHRHLEAGRQLLIFPEGTTTPATTAKPKTNCTAPISCPTIPWICPITAATSITVRLGKAATSRLANSICAAGR